MKGELVLISRGIGRTRICSEKAASRSALQYIMKEKGVKRYIKKTMFPTFSDLYRKNYKKISNIEKDIEKNMREMSNTANKDNQLSCNSDKDSIVASNSSSFSSLLEKEKAEFAFNIILKELWKDNGIYMDLSADDSLLMMEEGDFYVIQEADVGSSSNTGDNSH